LNKKAVPLILFLILLFLPVPQSYASYPTTTVQLNPSKDAYVRESNPDDNSGDSNYLLVCSTSGYRERAFLEFDLSSIPQGVIILSATLHLNRSTDGAEDRTYRINVVNEEWQELSITWNNQPSSISDVYVEHQITAASGWWNVSVTSLMPPVLNVSAISFRIIDANEGSGNIQRWFNSRENPDGGHPILEIEYATPATLYHVHGLFSEDGSFLGSTTMTVYLPNATYEIYVNGHVELRFPEKPVLFTFQLSGGGMRKIYITQTQETLYLFTPDANYTTYGFTVKDYTGQLTSGSYLEAWRYVNGTQRLIERAQLQNILDEVPLVLSMDRTYILQLQLPDSSTYRFGYYVTGVDVTPTLILREISFSRQAQLTYRYVTIEATRPSPTQIQVNYHDTLDQTLNVSLSVKLRNGTLVYSDWSSSNPVQFTWNAADNETDYVVYVTVSHSFFGALEYSKALAREVSFNSPPDLGVLGSWGGVSAGNILPAMLIIVVAGAFSTLTAPVGLFATVVTAAILTYLGWINVSYTVLAVAMSLAVLYGIAWVRKR